MNRIVIDNGTLVNEGRRFNGYIVIEGDRIARIGAGRYPGAQAEIGAGTEVGTAARAEAGTAAGIPTRVIDASGKLVLPGVIDDQVHFREPGMTYKADIRSESAAAVCGGVTSYMEMPNTNPPAVTLERLEEKFARAAEVSPANYSFYLGATNDNIGVIRRLDPRRVCGVKVFMGSSTGNLLVDKDAALAALFAESPVLIATHCEDEGTIRANIQRFREEYGDRATAALHPSIRSAEACYRSSAKAVELADRYGADLHILHLSTARELSLFDDRPLAEKKITNEVCVHHLWFTDADYAAKGNLIKWNPAVKSAADRAALRAGILSGKVDVVATDHAPHTLEEKLQPYWSAPSGGPLVQHSLIAMLEMSREGTFPVEKVVEKMCHAPAIRFAVHRRGFLREGYFADIVIVDPDKPWTVSRDNVRSKCGWSPFEGTEFSHSVTHTIVNGGVAYENGELSGTLHGRALEFER